MLNLYDYHTLNTRIVMKEDKAKYAKFRVVPCNVKKKKKKKPNVGMIELVIEEDKKHKKLGIKELEDN